MKLRIFLAVLGLLLSGCQLLPVGRYHGVPAGETHTFPADRIGWAVSEC